MEGEPLDGIEAIRPPNAAATKILQELDLELWLFRRGIVDRAVADGSNVWKDLHDLVDRLREAL